MKNLKDNPNLIAFEDFISGVKNRTVRFEVNDRKLFFDRFLDQPLASQVKLIPVVFLLLLLCIPFAAMKINTSLLLYGLVGMLLGFLLFLVASKTNRPFKQIVELSISFMALLSVLIFEFGLKDHFVFGFSSLVFSFILFGIRKKLYHVIFRNVLSRNSNLYYFALENKLVKVSRAKKPVMFRKTEFA